MKTKRQTNPVYKIIARILVCAIIFSMPITSFASDPVVQNSNKAEDVKVRVVASNIAADKTLELGIQVETGDTNFRSIGTVVKYDNTILEPITWESGDKPTTTAINGTSWSTATPLDTKGQDFLSGKTALAYNGAAGTDKAKDTYLFLSAESATPIKFATQTAVVTVRFQYKDSAVSITNAGMLGPDETNKVSFAPSDVIYKSLARNYVTYHTGAENYSYKHLSEDANGAVVLTDGIAVDKTLANVSFVAEGNGTTVNKGGSTPDGMASIVFYDWDDSKLGSIVVQKGEDATQFVEAFAETLKDQTAVNGYSTNTAFPLTNKLEYIFEGLWLDFGSGIFPCYREADDAYYTSAIKPTHIVKPTKDAEGVAKFENMQQNINVKAAYKAGPNINGGTDANYSILEPIYNRYGASNTSASGSYSLKVTVVRKNAAGYGVEKIANPKVRAIMKTDKSLTGNQEVSLYSVLSLGKTDVETGEMVPAKTIANVTYALIDSDGNGNWTTSPPKSLSLIKNKNAGGLQGSDGFVKAGTITFINEQGILSATGKTNSWAQVNALAFSDAGLSLAAVANNANTAKTNIINKFKTNGGQPLDWQGLQDAIDGK